MADKHREFYDEFLAVMDLTAEYYLQTIKTVFLDHALPKGEMVHRSRPGRPGGIRRVALMTVEGEKDDISGTRADVRCPYFVQELAAPPMKRHHLQPGAGHYGVFNGSRFRAEIVPKINDFHCHASAA